MEWRSCVWWDDYLVSDRGEVCRKKDGVVLKQYVQKSGYAAVFLKKDNWTSAVLVHRLVAMAFLSIVQGKDFVDHINTIRSDNRVENLRWVDAKGNANNVVTLKKRKKS